MTDFSCPLCKRGVKLYHRDGFRDYYQCSSCHLVHVPRQFHIGAEDEKALYDLHQNSPEDAGYLHFLSRLTNPLSKLLDSHSIGLDFGCGPGPALATVFQKQGHQVALYDPCYFDNTESLSKKYDFICATEVVEHFRRPREEFDLLFNLLKAGGWLGIMTKRVKTKDAFRTWHYIRDPTHIAFYHEKTFIWLAEKYGAALRLPENDVVLMQKMS